jgi:hypothetical protein
MDAVTSGVALSKSMVYRQPELAVPTITPAIVSTLACVHHGVLLLQAMPSIAQPS